MHRDANWVSDLRWLTGLAIDGGASLINWSVERLLAASIEIKVTRAGDGVSSSGREP